MIKLVRVDHRLIHGQVALVWANAIDSNCILVANDDVINNPIQQTTLKLAAPHNTKVVIKNIQDSAIAINSKKTDKYKLLIVVKTIKDALRLTGLVSTISEVNIGGVKESLGSKQLAHSIYVTSEEKNDLEEMIKKGIFVYGQQVPSDQKLDLKQYL